MESNYTKYRGKCKEFTDKAVEEDPSLTAVRGYYYDSQWGKQAHWWCKREDGTIFDPTAKQFPTEGKGIYEEFDGIIQCAQCNKEVREEDATIDGNYAFCSYKCHGIFIGF